MGGEYVINGKIINVPRETFEGKLRIWPGLRGGTWENAFDKQYNILYLANGSFIEFKTYKQAERDIQAFAGPPRHIIRHDEEPPLQVYNENQARQVTLKVNLLFTMTPLNYSQWIYGDLYEKSSTDPDIDVFMMASKDNPYANPDVLAKMAEDIVDPIERAARLEGKFTYSQGRVWKEYGSHNLIEPFQVQRDWHKSIIIDPHPEKATAVNWVAEDYDGRLFCYREGDYKGTVKEVCQQIKVDSSWESIDLILIDPSAKGQKATWGEESIFPEFQKEFSGIQLANNNRQMGWDKVRQMCNNNPGSGPRLFVMKCCPITDFQMRNYSWKPPLKSGESRGKAEVVKRNDDHCDNIRYRCMASFVSSGHSIKDFNIGLYGNVT